jgi:hypothetical protein
MDRPGHSDARFFFAREVEHTPAHGEPTLFVVGYQTQDSIDKALYNANLANAPCPVRHIFFGANDSYNPRTRDDFTAWESVIFTYLDRGFWCSLDIPFRYVHEFNDGGLCERDRFIPIIKVPIPYIRLWNYNTCVKIDDQDFAATNPGVWVHELRDLILRNRFTSWSQYDADRMMSIETKSGSKEVLDSQYPDGDDYWRAT